MKRTFTYVHIPPGPFRASPFRSVPPPTALVLPTPLAQTRTFQLASPHPLPAPQIHSRYFGRWDPLKCECPLRSFSTWSSLLFSGQGDPTFTIFPPKPGPLPPCRPSSPPHQLPCSPRPPPCTGLSSHFLPLRPEHFPPAATWLLPLHLPGALAHRSLS